MLITPREIKAIIANNIEPVRNRLAKYMDVADVINRMTVLAAVRSFYDTGNYDIVFDVLNVPLVVKSPTDLATRIFQEKNGSPGQSLVSLIEASTNGPTVPQPQVKDKAMYIVFGLFAIGLIIILIWQKK